jgi:hypothetical protein
VQRELERGSGPIPRFAEDKDAFQAAETLYAEKD